VRLTRTEYERPNRAGVTERVALSGVSERTSRSDRIDLVQTGLLEPADGRGRQTADRVRAEPR
jgi:hypothetical protein